MKLAKITFEGGRSSVEARRWYDDACGTAHALELVGERWSLLILRELMFGPRRFGDIRAALPGLSANVLSQRLETLEGHGLVVKSRLPPPASVSAYGLTEWGYEADQLMMVMGYWAVRSPGHDPTLPLSKTALMLSFRTLFLPEVAGDVCMTVGFRLGEDTFRVVIMDGSLMAARADIENANVVLTASPEAIAGFIYDGLSLDLMEASGAIALEGDRTKALAFRKYFQLPPKVVPQHVG